jgi:hypothetical protein
LQSRFETCCLIAKICFYTYFAAVIPFTGDNDTKWVKWDAVRALIIALDLKEKLESHSNSSSGGTFE